MKKTLVIILAMLCLLVMSGCGNTDAQDDAKNPTQNIANDNQDENPAFSLEDIAAMFSQAKESNWEYIDSVLISDNASARVGAVLFLDTQNETTNVAFFDKDGYYQYCSVDTNLSSTPDFTYLGDGKVTFKAETTDGIVYNYMLTISIDGSDVNFAAEDDLSKQ